LSLCKASFSEEMVLQEVRIRPTPSIRVIYIELLIGWWVPSWFRDLYKHDRWMNKRPIYDLALTLGI
jgi:hypothetical protein